MISGTGTGSAEGWGWLEERQKRNDLLLNLPQIEFLFSVHFTTSDPGSVLESTLLAPWAILGRYSVSQAASISSNHLLVNMPQ